MTKGRRDFFGPEIVPKSSIVNQDAVKNTFFFHIQCLGHTAGNEVQINNFLHSSKMGRAHTVSKRFLNPFKDSILEENNPTIFS